jgi:hypothetical protein
MVDTRGLVWPTGGCFKNCYVKGTQNPFLKSRLAAQTASCCLTLAGGVCLQRAASLPLDADVGIELPSRGVGTGETTIRISAAGLLLRRWGERMNHQASAPRVSGGRV